MRNKKRVIMIAVILITIIFIFFLVAFLSRDKKNQQETGKTSGRESTSEELEITTLAEEETIGLEDATVDQAEGNIDETVNHEEVEKEDELPYLIKVNRAQNCITIYKKDLSISVCCFYQ